MRAVPLAGKRPSKTPIAHSTSVAAPILGWNTRDPLANMKPEYAIALDNWFPRTGAVELRPGAENWASGLPSMPAKTIAAWRGAAGEKLFAFADTGTYDITAGGAVGASVAARTNGYNCTVNFNTTGGSYLIAVNGVDSLIYTNGTTWTTVATFTIGAGPSTIATNLFWNVNAYKRALYFIKKNSMSFFYLPIDQITGSVAEFPLGALFNKGGKLLAMGNWTVDGGVGQDDYSVFITSEGQAAVYLGTDPSSSATWALKGVYDLAPPLGLKCLCRFGSDLLVLTRRGLFSLTRILKEGKASEEHAVSAVIGDAFVAAAKTASTYEGWEVVEYPDYSALVVNVPVTNYTNSVQFVMNTLTGAWCRFVGWDAFSFCFFQKQLFMGLLGKVAKAFVPETTDMGASITANAKTAFTYVSPRSRLKSWRMVRPNLVLTGTVAVNVALDTDFGDDASFGAAVFNSTSSDRWDTSQWGTARWATGPTVRNEWLTVDAADSYCAAIRLRVIARNTTISWSADDILYEVGAMVG